MTLLRLVARGVLGHARAWAGTALGAALAAALIGGALALGGALEQALAARTAARAGPVTHVLTPAEGLLGEALATATGGTPALWRDAVVTTDGGGRGVLLVGLPAPHAPADGARLGASLADALGVQPGDRVVLRVERPSALPRDVALMQDEGRVVALPFTVADVVADAWPVTMALDADPLAPPAVIVPLRALQEALGQARRISGVLSERGALDVAPHLTPADVGLDVRGGVVSTPRVLLPPAVVDALAPLGAQPVLTWFLGGLSRGDARVPYLFAAGVPDVPEGTVALHPDTAARLRAAPGDLLTLRYPLTGRGREVTWHEATLRFDGELRALDPTWSPEIEGLTGRARCADWNPGLPLALDDVGDADEAYWAAHGATPQAVVSLADARRLWASPWGDTTSLRLAPSTPPEALTAALRATPPAALGLRTLDLRERLEATQRPSNDLGLLFLGFEAVLLGATFALVVLLSAFAVASRAGEWRALRAVGFSARRVAAVALGEAACVAVVGALLGLPLAALAEVVLLDGLARAWTGAVTGLTLRPAGVLTAAPGAAAAALLTLVGAGWAWRGREGPATRAPARPRWAWPVVVFLAAGALAALTPPSRSPEAAGVFFVSGGLVLLAVTLAARAALSSAAPPGLPALVLAGAARRPGRALSVVGLLGASAFIVAGVGLGAGMPAPDPSARSSGTGGFALYGASTLPWTTDPRAVPGTPDGLEVVALRLREGDDASCLQLGTARSPHLLGLDPSAMAAGGRFGELVGQGWSALTDPADGPVPVITDSATATWGLHVGLGDTLTLTDADGGSFDVRVVGLTPPSVLQGALLMHEGAFLRRFPSDGGPRVLLVDGPADAVAAAAALWGRVGADLGARFMPGAERLAVFTAVERTWIAVFRSLGLLGLALAAVGVGVVLARNLHERRVEHATLAALGFPPARVAALVLAEHAALLVLGLAGGAVAGLVAAWPAVRAADAPLAEVAAGLSGALALGLLALTVAVWRAPRGDTGRLLVDEVGPLE